MIELFDQQQALQRDTKATISKFLEIWIQYKNDHFLANLKIDDGKGDRSFLDWITQVEKIAMLMK